MTKKIIYLLVALALPGLLFIFLKIFGRNHFDIPVYYTDGVAGVATCGVIGTGQYTVPDTTLALLKIRGNVPCLIVDSVESNNREMRELRKTYDPHQLQLVSLEGLTTGRLNAVKNCALFLKSPWKAVLIDKEKRIRGYYAFVNLEEIDRLMVEVEILVTQ